MSAVNVIEVSCTGVATVVTLGGLGWAVARPWLREQLGLTRTIKEQVTNNHEKNFRDEVTEVHEDVKALGDRFNEAIQQLAVGQAETKAQVAGLTKEFRGRMGRLEGRVDGLYDHR